MTDREIAAWIDSIEIDFPNIASADDCWRTRELAHAHVWESPGPKDPEFRSLLWDLPPGQVV